MTDLPTKSDLTSGITTEAEFQTAIGALYDVVKELAVLGPHQALTIASDTITPSVGQIIIDTEGSASTDNLSFILATNVGSKVIFIRTTSAARVVTLKHNQSGTGKLWLAGAADAVLYDPTYVVALYWNATTTRWEELWRNFGLLITQTAEATAIKTALGLSGVYAPIASPTFTGTVTVPNPTAGDDSTKASSTHYVQGELATLHSTITGETTSAIAVGVQTAGQNSQGYRTVSTSAPSGGNNGDIWYRV